MEQRQESVHDILRFAGQSLAPLFTPRSIAVIGATEKAGSVGRTITWNLVSNPFGGVVFPVNPRRSSVLGIKAYPTIADVPEKVDLAVIVTPAPTVPDLIAECVAAGIPGAIIISAGFRELGADGAELERRIREHACGRMRVIGPNCLGVMNPNFGLNATFAATMARPGSVAFVSQSGALCTAILDWSLREKVGFSAFVSMGSMLDVSWGHVIDYLGDDPRTRSILVYMESVGDARAFISAAREVALTKPIIVIKAGRTEEAARAAVSHTGTLAGSDDVLDAAFKRCGVLRVRSIADLFYMAEVLATQPPPRGRRLTILTNAGGPAVLATDALVSGGGELAALTPETFAELNALLPPHWSRANPIDILGDATPERYAHALRVAARDPGSDGLLVVLTPQDMTDATRTAEELKAYAHLEGKPLLASWMGEAQVAAGNDILNSAGIPTFPYPDSAARAFNYMWRYSSHLASLYETPELVTEDDEEAARGREEVAALVRDAGAGSRTLLTEYESKRLLAAYDIPSVRTEIAASESEALAAAESIGYPVALKLHSETITHKTDVGGIALDIDDADAVARAYRRIRESVTERAGAEHFLGVTVQPMVRAKGVELIVGSSTDAQFGPVLLFGSGGELVEVFRDRALALPPLTTTLARRMIEETTIHKALGGVRGRPPVDRHALERLLVRFSRLIVEHPRIKEADLNPVLASADGVVALDARFVLHDASVPDAELPAPAIRPYPSQYTSALQLADGTMVTLRPIRPEDEPLVVRFHESLSERSVQLRYLQALKLRTRTEHRRLIRVCFVDFGREVALVATHETPERPETPETPGGEEIVAIARLRRLRVRDEAEFSLIVADAFQRRGLGTALLGRLLEVGRLEGMRNIVGYLHVENTGMRRICERLGFTLRVDPAEGVVEARIS